MPNETVQQYLSVSNVGRNFPLSNTEYLGRSTKQFHPKELKRIVDRASSLIKATIEPNATVRVMADTMVADFGFVVTLPKKMTFKESITVARLASAVPPHQCEKWEHKAGAATAASALELSAKIELRQISFSKALVQMNRVVTQREKAHRQQAGSDETFAQSRHPKPIPISSGRGHGSSTRSAKQPYKRPNKAQGRRRHAA